MNKPFKYLMVSLGCCALTGRAVPKKAEPAGNPPGNTVSVVVTATGLHGKLPPGLTGHDVLVYHEQEQLPVIDVTPLQKERAELDLSILLDDSLESTVSQLAEVADFIRALPPTTRVAVAYIRNPTFVMGQDLTTDRELAVKALQVPLGSPRQFDSPYLALTDLIEAMPENGHRRAVLIISDGEDRFRGPFDPVSPDLEPACQEAERRGVLVYTIYATGVGRVQNAVRILDDQGGLSQLAQETGGEAFLKDSSTPGSLKPYLRELQQILSQQYLISFQAAPDAAGGYEHFKFTTEFPDVELNAPGHVYVPGGK